MVSDGGVVTCEICAYFDEHGWIGPYRSHCRGLLPDGTRCCRTWTAPKASSLPCVPSTFHHVERL